MRLLIYGMQSSGASSLAFVLAQKPRCAAFVDIWTMYAAPALTGSNDALAKVVVTTAFPLPLHQERFRPDRTILMLRHPVVNYRSLAKKPYRHECGFVEEKFAALDRVFADRSAYDAIVHFEDLIFDPLPVLRAVSDLGWDCEPGFLRLERRQADIVAFNEERFPEIKERLGYGIGNYHGGAISEAFAQLADADGGDGPVADWCPAVAAHYRQLLLARRERWRLDPSDGKTASLGSNGPGTPQLVVGLDEGRVAVERVRLDQCRRGKNDRHLDISIFGLAVEGEAWPHAKFKFCRARHGLHLEFREMTGWPLMFTEFPGGVRDEYGIVLRLFEADLAAADWPTDRDRLLLRAILALLPQAVAAAVIQSELPEAECRDWLDEARGFAERCLARAVVVKAAVATAHRRSLRHRSARC
jgi:hypothetical protein